MRATTMARLQAAKAATSRGAKRLRGTAGKDIDLARDTIAPGQT